MVRLTFRLGLVRRKYDVSSSSSGSSGSSSSGYLASVLGDSLFSEGTPLPLQRKVPICEPFWVTRNQFTHRTAFGRALLAKADILSRSGDAIWSPRAFFRSASMTSSSVGGLAMFTRFMQRVRVRVAGLSTGSSLVYT